MSLHDVTRAFQQVPSSSSGSPAQRGASLTPPLMNLHNAQPTYAYSLPHPNPNMRSPYPPYASPVLTSSPSPTTMYPMAPSPVPARMAVSAHAPVYNQWMPPTGPAPAGPAGMYRAIASPYPPSLISYTNPNGHSPMYGPPAPTTPNSQPNGVQQSRGRGMPMMSPVLQPAGQHAIYPGSPVMLHPSGMPVAQNHGYMPLPPPGRGQHLRSDHVPGPHMQQTPAGHPPPPLPHSGGFTQVPQTSFVRPTW
jgi:serine/arginine repetitive matrix protein 2